MHRNVRIQRSAGLLSEVAGISRKEPHADTAKERTFRLKNSKGLRRQRKNFPVEISSTSMFVRSASRPMPKPCGRGRRKRVVMILKRKHGSERQSWSSNWIP